MSEIAAVVILPPPGAPDTPENRRSIAAYCDGLAMEDYHRQATYDLWNRCQYNAELYLYDRRANRKSGRYRAYKIQSAVNSNAATQTATPAKIKVKQRSTGTPPKYYFNVNAAPPHMANMPSADFPLRPEEVAMLQAIIQKAAMDAAVTGQAPAIDPAILYRLDDFTLRAALEEVAQAKFEAGNGNYYLRENVTYNGVFGFQFTSQKWDDIERRPKWRAMEPVCVHCDSTKTNISEMAYYQEDEFQGKYEALQEYRNSPKMVTAIHKWAQAGPPTLAGAVPFVMPDFWRSRFFTREVIIIRKTWLRNQPYPLTPEESLLGGFTVEHPISEQSPISQEVSSEPVVAQIAAESSDMGDDSGGRDSPVLNPPVTAPTRLGHFRLGEDGNPDLSEEIIFPHPELVRYSIREIEMVAGEVIRDAECERTNIPAWHNVNVRIPWTPWGQGTPEILERLEEGYNNALTDIIVNGEYAATPSQVTFRSVVKDNPKLANGAYTQPGVLYVVSDDTWMKNVASGNKDLVQTLQPPATPSDQWKRLEVLGQIIADASDQSPARRGEAPTANASGALTEALQAAGNLNVMFKSSNTEDMLKYGVEIMIGDILTRMTPEQLAEDFPKYPVYVWKELHRLLVQHYLLCEASVQIASGGQAAQSNRVMLLANLRKMNIGISETEIMEGLDLDALEQAEKQSELERSRAMLMSMGPQPAQDGGKPQQDGKKQLPQGRPQPQQV